MPAREFLLSLPKPTQKRLFALFQHVAGTLGKGVSPQMFCHERDEIWTFKCKLEKRRIRMPCFRRGRRWIVTHGFVKPPQPMWPEQEFTLAFAIMREITIRESQLEKQRGKE
jgi:hypothetical protein